MQHKESDLQQLFQLGLQSLSTIAIACGNVFILNHESIIRTWGVDSTALKLMDLSPAGCCFAMSDGRGLGVWSSVVPTAFAFPP